MNRLKLLINFLTIVALLVLVVVSMPQIREVFGRLQHTNLRVLIFLIPLQLLNFHAIGKIYSSYFNLHGIGLPSRMTERIAYELNFVNHVFPSGGVSGFSYLGLRLKREGVPTSQATLAQIVRFGMTFLSFILIVVLGIVLLALGNNVNNFTILVSTSVIAATIFGTLALTYIISDKGRIKSFSLMLPRVINHLLQMFGFDSKVRINLKRIENFLENLHDNYRVLTEDRKKLRSPFLWSLVANIAEIMTILVVYWALGTFVNPGAVIIAYAVANFAGLIAVLPGGIGVYESLMTITLAASGVPSALALSAHLTV